MANEEHLAIIRKGVDDWNQWRKKNITIKPDLSGANLSLMFLEEANLMGANLRGASLSRSNLKRARLIFSDLTQANLTAAILCGAELARAKLSQASFNNASLMTVQAVGCDFKDSTLTGACIQSWNIDSSTRLDKTICEYIFLKHLGGPRFVHTQTGMQYYPAEFGGRCPSSGSFKTGEFATLFQLAIDTVDLIFQDGIDWQAFFQSFQDLRNQYADQDLAIQAIERKQGGAFVVRLEVSEGADKSAIESDAKQLYENRVKALEAQYEKQLRLQGEQHLEEIRCLIAAERQEKATLMGVLTTMASNQGSKFDLRGAQIAGGIADTVQGDQHGGIINNYGSSAEDITRLLSTLRDQAQAFPTDQKDEALDILDDLEGDLSKSEPDQDRIGRRLKKLTAIATLLTGLASRAATVSGDLSDFTSNVIELTEKLGIPIEQVQLPPSNTP